MKHTLLILLTSFSFNLMAQKVGKTSIEDIAGPYLKIHIAAKGDIFKPYQNKIFVDYGQVSKQSEVKNGFVYDKKGIEKKFNGIVDALNFFYGYGWELIDSYPLGSRDEGDENRYHYILRKKR